MATKFGRIAKSDISFGEQVYHKNQSITNSSEGTNHFLAIRDHKPDPDSIIDVTGSHWAFVHNMFYMSGSKKVLTDQPADAEKFNSIFEDFNQYNDLKPFFKHKFYDTASVFYIPQVKFGERIKPKSFVYTDLGYSSSIDNSNPKIVDDGNGNLYSTNAIHSQSAGALSSSNNYVGNIFYDLGVAVLTETASWSGSVNYTDFGNTYKMDFNSTSPIFTTEYSIKIPASEFNTSMNASTKLYHGGDYLPDEVTTSGIGVVADLRAELTGSNSFGQRIWSPYVTQIHLYESQTGEPVMVANLPRAIKMRRDTDLIITFRVDH